MKYYKVIIKKICLVGADDVDDATERAIDEDFLMKKEDAVEVSELTTSQRRRLEIQLMEDEDVF